LGLRWVLPWKKSSYQNRNPRHPTASAPSLYKCDQTSPSNTGGGTTNQDSKGDIAENTFLKYFFDGFGFGPSAASP
jgi:hypothetical protein